MKSRLSKLYDNNLHDYKYLLNPKHEKYYNATKLKYKLFSPENMSANICFNTKPSETNNASLNHVIQEFSLMLPSKQRMPFLVEPYSSRYSSTGNENFPTGARMRPNTSCLLSLVSNEQEYTQA